MAQSGRNQWVLFSKHDRHPVDVTSEEPPLPYGTGNPKRLRETVLSLSDTSKVLDLGCSAACWSPIFEGLDYYGLDQDLEIFQQARINVPAGKFVQAVGENIPFPNHTFDLVFTSQVLQHNDHYPEKDVIVREIFRVLRVGGYYLMVESTSEEATPQDQTFSAKGWIKFLEERGFKLVSYVGLEEYLFQKGQE
jgi:ubiquinone/menaquinone biosynthesis C-methylase UbiE